MILTYQACLLLGSNIVPEENLPQALTLLSQRVKVDRVSSFWETPAVGSDDPNFLNAAVLVRTDLPREQLKTQVLRGIEKELGRVRTADKYAPRPIDIDIVTWECEVIDDDVWRYAHAAVPVSQVLPCEAISPGGESLHQAAERLMQMTEIHLHSKFS